MTDYYCDCDYDPADVWNVTMPHARIRHKCTECNGPIIPGEQYERVESLYDGAWTTYKTCQRCLNVVAYVTAHVPCFCWYRQGLYEDGGAVDTCAAYAHHAPGLLFGLGRLLVKKNQFRAQHKEAMK